MNLRAQAQRGFTLIELLVVMAIIAILVALIVTIVQNVRENAMIAATNAEIQVIVSALDSYRAEYLSYPPVFMDWTLEPGTAPASAELTAVALRRNEVLYQWLTEKFDAIGKGAATGPFLTTEKIRYSCDLGSVLGQTEFCDAWGEPLVFCMPGVDHTGEVDSDGNAIPACDSTMLKLSGTAGDWDVDAQRYDLYSLGPDGIDGTTLASATAAMFSTTYDKNGDGGTWSGSISSYDAIKGTAPSVGDDIGTWKFMTRKSSNN